MSDDCVFCRIVRGDIPSAKIYEDDQVLAFLDIGPLSDGHCLVIPKKHYERFDQCPPAQLSALSSALAAVARATVQAVNAEGYNLLNNNGRCAGQLVKHVHFHVIPRNSGDGLLAHWPAKKYPSGRLDELTQKIKDLLD